MHPYIAAVEICVFSPIHFTRSGEHLNKPINVFTWVNERGGEPSVAHFTSSDYGS